ncbi:MAG: hypothetical protein A2X57_08880 [Nitrospirae bacterium GWD2_57_8]|nr:MAG: hypothetical protein A2X57_08880 [Nitrospirae bacterium GWD2_57_8]
MSEAVTPDKANQVWEVGKILISVCLGYFLSIVSRISADRKSISNVKAIIFKELSENYKRINPVLPKDNNFHPGLIDLPVQFSQTLIFDVYEKYLGRLAELKKEMLAKIYDACYHLAEFSKGAKNFLPSQIQNAGQEPTEVERLKIRIFIQNAVIAREKTEAAIKLFRGGDALLRNELSNRGAEYERVFGLANQAAGSLKGQ